MKSFAFVLVIVMTTTAFCASGVPADTNKYVGCTLAVSDSVISRGGSVTLLFMLRPVDGVHINSDPAPEFSLSGENMSVSSDTMQFVVETSSGRLDSEKPLTCVLSISKDFLPGAYIFRGTLSYFFCSDEKGWCNHFDQPVTIHIRIRQ